MKKANAARSFNRFTRCFNCSLKCNIVQATLRMKTEASGFKILRNISLICVCAMLSSTLFRPLTFASFEIVLTPIIADK
jgi:hypothetical protein